MTEELEDRRSGLSPAKRALLEQRLRGKSAGSHQAIPPVPRSGALPLSFAQERLWFLDRLGFGSAYNMAQVLVVSGPLDVDVLRRSVDAIVARHEILRTAYPEQDGEPVQRIESRLSVPLPVTDLSSTSEAALDREIQRLAEREASHPFDLAGGSPLRVAVARLGVDEHVLFFTLHHIAGDDWSQQLFTAELLSHHAALRAGAEPVVPELKVQYADYAAWQKERLRGDLLQEQLSYWQQKLADLTTLDLPLDHARPPVQTFAGASRVFEVPAPVATAIGELARAQGVTVGTALLAAFQLLLARHTGQEDIVVGSPVANRPRPELENLIGLFVSTVVMRTDLAGDPTFTELLQRAHRTTLDAQQHQELPFERLVEVLRPERDLSKNPLFQVLFAMQTPGGGDAPTELEVRGYGLEAESTRFDLELNVRVVPDSIAGRFCFNTDLFEAETIERMAGHYGTLLAGIVANPAARLSELAMLSGDERHRVVVTFNDNEVPFPRDALIHELVAAVAERAGGAPAVVCGEEQLSYRELNERANRLAHHLRARGVGPEVLVGVCLERGVDLVVALLAVLKAGGAYVPLDPEYPAARLAFMLTDTAAPVVVTHTAVRERVPDSTATIVAVDEAAAAIASESNANPARGSLASGDAAYVIYTSGSTGRPKGVVITHRNAGALLHWAPSVFDEEDLAGVLASTSVCFDLSVFELFVPLAHGGTVILADNALALPTMAARERVRLVNTVPSAIEEILAQDGLPRSVRTVCLAGEPLLPGLVDRLYASGVKRVFDLYGPSEDTTYTTCALRRVNGPATVGRPLPNKQVYILDARREPVPSGVVGELWIGGEGVARGYLGAPEATAEKFRADPFRAAPGRRLYRTGDLARFRHDGNIEFLGRSDHQIKLRGFRIETGEIEVALRSHAEVRSAAVVPWRMGSSEARLIGYVVPENGELSTDVLRSFLADRLPRYMVPDTLMLLDGLPMTPNGKLDRAALPQPDGSAIRAEEYAPPRTPVEEELAEVWQSVLGVERVGINDDFFELGGHSLLAARLFARVRSRFGTDLPLRTVFVAPTVAGMALEIVQRLLEEES